MAHLLHSPSGHLLRNGAGHLLHSGGHTCDECCPTPPPPVDCNTCDPPLASTYMVHATYNCAGTPVDCTETVTYVGSCTWNGSGDCGSILNFTGANWVITVGCIAGSIPLFGSGDPCSPIGDYTNLFGDTATVS